MLRSELRAKLRELQRDQVGDPTGRHGQPELPSRFPLRVSSTDRKLLELYKDQGTLEPLELRHVDGKHEVMWPEHGRLGSFSRREAAILDRLGAWLVLYQVRMLEISRSGWVAVELVRPLLSVCHKCGRVYPAGSKVCERDRSALHDEQGAAVHLDFVDLREQLQQEMDE
jgi:hypothetical protein